MNKQGKGKIEWTDFSWNPLCGLCPVNCETPDGVEYCYARKIYKRFHLDEKPRLSSTELMAPQKKKKPLKIFVCSTYELFHPSVPKEFRDAIFRVIESCPQHTLQILTKMPENIDRVMPDNVWLGVTITGNQLEDFERAAYFGYEPRKARIQFISYEPIFEYPIQSVPNIDWIIIGRLKGHGHRYDQPREWIEDTVRICRKYKIPVFLKDNLAKIWGEKLIQEWPE